MEDIVAFFDHIGRFVVGRKVFDDEQIIKIRKGFIMAIREIDEHGRPAPGQSRPVPLPLDLVNELPNVQVKHFNILKDNNQEVDRPFDKRLCAFYDIKDEFKAQYIALTEMQQQITQQKSEPPPSAEKNVIKLFD